MKEVQIKPQFFLTLSTVADLEGGVLHAGWRGALDDEVDICGAMSSSLLGSWVSHISATLGTFRNFE
jgi:copper oxidase (laccase) domain-containing protein